MAAGFAREQLAIWHRQRKRWAVLAGQLLRLARLVEDSESKGDKESRVAAALVAWCRAPAPNPGQDEPGMQVPGQGCVWLSGGGRRTDGLGRQLGHGGEGQAHRVLPGGAGED
jgi:hypothetical protein